MNCSSLSETNTDVSRGKSQKWLHYGLILFFISEYANPYIFIPFLKIFHLSSLIPLTLFVFWFFNGNRERVKAPQNKILIGLMVLVFFSVTHALITMRAFESFKQFLGYLFIYFVIINSSDTEKKFRELLVVLIVIHLFLILLNIEFFTETGRTKGLLAGYFIGDGNDYSLSVNIILPLALYLYVVESKIIKKILFGIMFAVLFAVIIIVESRASSLTLAVIIIYLWLRSKRKLVGVILILLLTLVLLLLASTSYFDRINSIRNYEEDSSASMRLEAWEAGMKMAYDYPLNGVGANNFSSVYGRYYRKSDLSGWAADRWIAPHSIYIQTLAEIGFIAVFLLIALHVVNMRYCAQLRKASRTIRSANRPDFLATCLEMSIIGYSINSAFLGGLYYPHIFVLSAIVVSAHNIFSKEETNIERITLH